MELDGLGWDESYLIDPDEEDTVSITRSEHKNPSSSVSSVVNWLDSEGRLLHGKHKGSLAERVAITDHSYIQWLVDNIENMNEEDREILSSLLRYNNL